jgi:hypothetical protein
MLMSDIESIARTIKVLVEKGDHAKEKAQQFYISAGQHLKTLREATPSKAEWARLIDEKCGLGVSRAYELIQIADGKTVEKVRADTKERVRKHRAARPLRNGQPASRAPTQLDVTTANAICRFARELVQLSPGLARNLCHILQQGNAARLADLLPAEIEKRATNGGGIEDQIQSLH